jgi:multiple sugar transport system substrate-binding protein
VANFNQDEVAAAILNGSSLAAFTWPILMGNVDDPEASRVSGKVGIMPFPKGEDQATLSGSWYLAVTATSDVGPQAYDFIEFLTSKESQMAEAVAGMPPMRKSVLTDPELVETHWWFPTTLEALDIARPRATFPEWPKVEDIFGTYLSKALIGDMTPQAAMDQACSEITDVITQAGYYE